MSRGLLLLLGTFAALPGWLHLPVAIERWLYNPRERTAVAEHRLSSGDPAGAVRALDTAVRLAPDDPRTLYNAGTVRLAADAGGADRYLEEAAQRVAPESPLAPDLYYNLGNARLEAGDAAGAAEALRQVLRLDSSRQDAKRNLEIALRRLEEERSGWRRPRETPSGRRQGEREAGEGGSPHGDERPQPRRDESGSPPRERPLSDDSGRAEAGRTSATESQALPGFEQQTDMTAAQAAAILDAIEDRERELRRAAASERARRVEGIAKDW